MQHLTSRGIVPPVAEPHVHRYTNAYAVDGADGECSRGHAHTRTSMICTHAHMHKHICTNANLIIHTARHPPEQTTHRMLAV